MNANRDPRMRSRQIGPPGQTEAYHAQSLPNSSAVFTVTLLADMEDALAVIRTAVLLSKSLKIATIIDLPGEAATYFESHDNAPSVLSNELLESIRAKLHAQACSPMPVFALEATVTGASFLNADTVSVRIRNVDVTPEPQTPMR